MCFVRLRCCTSLPPSRPLRTLPAPVYRCSRVRDTFSQCTQVCLVMVDLFTPSSIDVVLCPPFSTTTGVPCHIHDHDPILHWLLLLCVALLCGIPVLRHAHAPTPRGTAWGAPRRTHVRYPAPVREVHIPCGSSPGVNRWATPACMCRLSEALCRSCAAPALANSFFFLGGLRVCATFS